MPQPRFMGGHLKRNGIELLRLTAQVGLDQRFYLICRSHCLLSSFISPPVLTNGDKAILAGIVRRQGPASLRYAFPCTRTELAPDVYSSSGFHPRVLSGSVIPSLMERASPIECWAHHVFAGLLANGHRTGCLPPASRQPWIASMIGYGKEAVRSGPAPSRNKSGPEA